MVEASTWSDARPPLMIWLNNPPQVERGALDFLAAKWPNDVAYVCAKPLPDYRAHIGWGADSSRSAARLELLPPDEASGAAVQRVLSTNPNAIHLVAGFSGASGAFLRALVSRGAGGRTLVYTERPGVYGPPTERLKRGLGLRMKYRSLARSYKNEIAAVLPLGEAGAQSFLHMGWPKAKTYPFMYSPPDPEPEVPLRPPRWSRPRTAPQDVRLLYVGRLSRYTKGTDVLIKAVGSMSGRAAWQLDIVGGYGDLLDEVTLKAKSDDNIKLHGSLSPKAVSYMMAEYDACIVPSTFDGWNVVVNESIRRGLGVIVSDEAVSHELVQSSGAGTVVQAGRATPLRNAMEQLIYEPQMADAWGRAALRYRDRISNESVGSYLRDIIDHSVLHVTESRPQKPW